MLVYGQRKVLVLLKLIVHLYRVLLPAPLWGIYIAGSGVPSSLRSGLLLMYLSSKMVSLAPFGRELRAAIVALVMRQAVWDCTSIFLTAQADLKYPRLFYAALRQVCRADSGLPRYV